MKIMDVPKEITVKYPTPVGEKEEVISFKKFITHHLDNYEAIKTVSQLRQAQKIIDVIEASKEAINLEDADYEVVKGAASTQKYGNLVARQLLPYYDAVDKAQGVPK